MRKDIWFTILLTLAILLGVVMRVVDIRDIPPGLYHDEAFTGIDGFNTLKTKEYKLFYESSFGREPLFTWLVANSIRIWGKTPFAIRFPALIAGIITLLVIYPMTQELYDKRIALFATVVLSVTLWHIHFSRVGFRATLIPPLSSIAVWQVAAGIRNKKYTNWILAGIATGMLLYTYMAARLAIIPALVVAIFAWHQGDLRNTKIRRAIILYLIIAALVMFPFVLFTLTNWENVSMRAKTVESIFNMDKPIERLVKNVFRAAGMFFIRGDFQYRHNVALRPVFDPALGSMFLVGLWLILKESKYDIVARFLLSWMIVMLVPTILTKDCPHFIRSIGLLPFVVVFPARGMDWLWQKLQKTKFMRNTTIGFILLFGTFSTSNAYFIHFPSIPEPCYWFECAGTQLAFDVNEYLETGWTEGELITKREPGRKDRQVFVQFQLWKDFVNAHYLIPDSFGFNVPQASEIESRSPQPNIPMTLYGWYNKHYPEYWVPEMEKLPPNSLLEVFEGPYATTDQDPEPHPAYLKFVATPQEIPVKFLAELENGVKLVDYSLENNDEGLVITLIWYTEEIVRENYKIFVHYERNEQVINQADAYPAQGYHLTKNWRPGDQLIDNYTLPLSEIQTGDKIWVGMYTEMNLGRLPVHTSKTQIKDDRIMIPVD